MEFLPINRSIILLIPIKYGKRGAYIQCKCKWLYMEMIRIHEQRALTKTKQKRLIFVLLFCSKLDICCVHWKLFIRSDFFLRCAVSTPFFNCIVLLINHELSVKYLDGKKKHRIYAIKSIDQIRTESKNVNLNILLITITITITTQTI